MLISKNKFHKFSSRKFFLRDYYTNVASFPKFLTNMVQNSRFPKLKGKKKNQKREAK